MMLSADITLMVSLHPEQIAMNSLRVTRLKLLANRHMSLIHLSTLVAVRNGLLEEEWPNFEFYPNIRT